MTTIQKINLFLYVQLFSALEIFQHVILFPITIFLFVFGKENFNQKKVNVTIKLKTVEGGVEEYPVYVEKRSVLRPVLVPFQPGYVDSKTNPRIIVPESYMTDSDPWIYYETVMVNGVVNTVSRDGFIGYFSAVWELFLMFLSMKGIRTMIRDFDKIRNGHRMIQQALLPAIGEEKLNRIVDKIRKIDYINKLVV